MPTRGLARGKWLVSGCRLAGQGDVNLHMSLCWSLWGLDSDSCPRPFGVSPGRSSEPLSLGLQLLGTVGHPDPCVVVGSCP